MLPPALTKKKKRSSFQYPNNLSYASVRSTFHYDTIPYAKFVSVPAAVVLRKIATIINADAHPLPYPYRNIKQKAVVHQDEYKLEVCPLRFRCAPVAVGQVALRLLVLSFVWGFRGWRTKFVLLLV